MPKPKSFIYMVRIPDDKFESRDWYAIYPTRIRAMQFAHRHVQTDDRLTEVRYFRWSNPLREGNAPPPNAITVEQLEDYYHGA